MHDEETGGLAVFAVNRGSTDITFELDLRAFGDVAGVAHVCLAAGDETNTAEAPERVVPATLPAPAVDGGTLPGPPGRRLLEPSALRPSPSSTIPEETP